MELSLLTTKWQIPPQPHRSVSRARLLAALEQGIPYHKLSLIAAPAGYGKTTLLAQWAHLTDIRVTWLSIDEDVNHLERFLRYLLAGWEAVAPDIIESKLGILLGARMADTQAVLSAFVNAANDAVAPLVFVLDDYHLIEDPSIHQAMTYLLDHLPPTFHFVLSGRREPSLPLARYRAHGAIQEFHAEDLAFSWKETSEFLKQEMEMELAQIL